MSRVGSVAAGKSLVSSTIRTTGLLPIGHRPMWVRLHNTGTQCLEYLAESGRRDVLIVYHPLQHKSAVAGDVGKKLTLTELIVVSQ